MREILFECLGVTVTGWKLVGYCGVFMFSARWFVQMVASRRAGRPVVPILFWYMSMVGSLMCLAYFVFGKNDSVGILAYLFPSSVSAYNVYLELAHRRRSEELAAAAETDPR